MRIVVTLLLAANLGQGGIFILEDGEASRCVLLQTELGAHRL